MYAKLLADKKIILKTIFVLFIVNIGNAVSLVTQILLSKNLDINDFGFFYSSVALITLCISPILSQNLLIQENISNLDNNNSFKKFYVNRLYKFFFFFLIVYFIFYLIFFEKIQLYLGNDNETVYYKLFTVLIFTILSLVPSSFLVSQKKYTIPSKIFTILDFLRLIILLLYFYYFKGNKIEIIINIQLIFVALIFFSNHLFMAKSLNVEPKKITNNKNSFSKNYKIVAYSMIFPVILQIDIVIVTYLFDSINTSQYIVVSTISKIIYFFFGSIYPIIFNEFLEKIGQVKIGLVIFYIISIILGGLCIVFGGKYFIILTYDEIFHSGIKLIYFIAPAMILLSITNILCSYLISIKYYEFIKFYILTIIIFTVISLQYASSLLNFVIFFLAMCLVLYLIASIYLIKKNVKKNF